MCCECDMVVNGWGVQTGTVTNTTHNTSSLKFNTFFINPTWGKPANAAQVIKQKQMKKLMFTVGMLMYTAIEGAAGGNSEGAKQSAPPLESEKLTELNAKLLKQDEFLTAAKTFDERMKAMGEMMATQEAIKTEEASIKKANVAAAIKAANDKKTAMVDNFAAAVLADAKVQAGKGTADEKAASTAELTKLSDELKNAVLGSVKAAPTTTGAATGGKGETGKKIIAAYLAGIASGLDSTAAKKAIIADPYDNVTTFSRGTVGAEVKAYLDAQSAS